MKDQRRLAVLWHEMKVLYQDFVGGGATLADQIQADQHSAFPSHQVDPAFKRKAMQGLSKQFAIIVIRLAIVWNGLLRTFVQKKV